MAPGPARRRRAATANLIGTGPFKLTDWVPNEQLRRPRRTPTTGARTPTATSCRTSTRSRSGRSPRWRSASTPCRPARSTPCTRPTPSRSIRPPRPDRGRRDQRLESDDFGEVELHHAERVQAAVRQHQRPPGGRLRDRPEDFNAIPATASSPRPTGRSPRATSATSRTPASRVRPRQGQGARRRSTRRRPASRSRSPTRTHAATRRPLEQSAVPQGAGRGRRHELEIVTVDQAT